MSPQDFLHAILADPEADTPRLIYADWLEEQGDPRGEFIRVQLRLVDPDLEEDEHFDLHDRETELLREHEATWVEPLQPLVEGWKFHRGFVEYVRVRAKAFITSGTALFDHEPIQSLALMQTRDVEFESLIDMPSLGRLAGLSLSGCSLGTEHLEVMAHSPHLGSLRKLLLGGNGFGPNGVEALADAHHWERLELLDLSSNLLRNDAIIPLASSPHFPSLTTLFLSQNQIRETGARALAKSRYLQRLSYLDMRGNPLTRRAMDALRSRFGKSACQF